MKSVLPPVDRPATRANARVAVTEYVRALIYEGALRGGDRVPQQEIADQLGVSRIPVRESLVALEAEGLVAIEPHRGAFVSHIDAAAIADHYEVYGLVYGHAARCAAERASEAALREIHAAAAEVASARDADAMLHAAGAFRLAVLEAGGSPSLRGLMGSMAGVVPGNFFAVVPGALDVATAGFGEMMAAIEARDGDTAFAATLEMMRAHGRNVNRDRERALAERAESLG